MGGLNMNDEISTLQKQLAEKDRELARCSEMVEYQIGELIAISKALGTNEGHSSVYHIEQLVAKCAALEELERAAKNCVISDFGVLERFYLEDCVAALDAGEEV